MLGQKSKSDPLPPAACSEDKERWMYEKDLDSVEIDLENSALPSNDQTREDRCFSYPDGPGHPDASPQQLAIIRKLMESVGMESFRPDFAESAQSTENKWLLKISEKIFVKLVECGEYPGVSLNIANREYINKYFATHFQSLKKRYF